MNDNQASRLRILFVINAYGKPSGAEHVLVDFLKNAPEIEAIFLLIGPDHQVKHEFIEVAAEKDIKYVFTNVSLNSAFSRLWLMKIFRAQMLSELSKNKIISELQNDTSIDIVYFNNSFEAASFYPLFIHKRIIVHIHDMVDMFRNMHKKCVLEACGAANHIITASYACKKQLVDNGVPDNKVTVAYNGMKLNAIPFEQHNNERLTIGFVGSVIRRKGFDVFIDIINRIEQLQHELRGIEIIVITNSNKEAPYLIKNLERLNPAINQRILTNLPRMEVFKMYSSMDMLIVPSRFDPLPTVVLEASLKGVPVFGTYKDGIPEMLCDDRMMFPVDNVGDATERIISWLNMNNVTQKEIINTLQIHILDKFTDDVKKRQVFNVIAEILS